MEEEKNVCCKDGTCDLCTKSEKDKVVDDGERINISIKDKPSESEKMSVISEIDKEKIKSEVKSIERKRDNKKSRNFRKEKSNMSKNNKKSPVNKALVFVLVAVIGASVIAGIMAVNFFNEFKGDKISKDVFDGVEVVELDDQTWVLQTEPKVMAEVITSEDCGEDCNVNDVTTFLKVQIPTLEIKEVDVTNSGFDLKYVPAIVFDENVTKTDFYSRANDLFTEENGKYVLQTAQLDFPVKQLGEMTDDTGFTVGDANAKVSVIAVTDFGCAECAVANPILDKFEVEYKNKAKFTYKIYTNVEDEKLMNVSLAAFCADEQGKFDAYADNLFVRQTNWMAFEGDVTNVLGNYAASLRLDKVKFDECLSSKKYEDKVKEMNKEIMDYGFTSIPVYFVDGERIDGVPTYEGMGAIMKSAASSTN